MPLDQRPNARGTKRDLHLSHGSLARHAERKIPCLQRVERIEHAGDRGDFDAESIEHALVVLRQPSFAEVHPKVLLNVALHLDQAAALEPLDIPRCRHRPSGSGNICGEDTVRDRLAIDEHAAAVEYD
jgi:hypothetical protein